jgi:hypothetical protein
MDTTETNIPTEHRPMGAALNPTDRLNRENENVARGHRQWNADSQQDPDTKRNASALPGGMADDGATSEEGSDGGEDQSEDGFADDGTRSAG